MLVRHTQPDVAPGVCYGRTDLDVSASFASDAAAVAALLPRVERVVTSPLVRCAKLAGALASAFCVSVETDPRLMEMDFGRWEGRLWSDIPRNELNAWAGDFLHARPHGGESVAMLRARTWDALADWRAAGTATVLATHAGVIKSALSTGDTAEDFAMTIDFGAAVSLAWDQGAAP